MNHPSSPPPLGPLVAAAIRPMPKLIDHFGQAVRLSPLNTSHADDLWTEAQDADQSWAYLRYGPFQYQNDLTEHVRTISGLPHQPFFAVLPASSDRAEGWMSFCDISPDNASIEIGSIWFSPRLQRTRAATEAVYLLLLHAFELGYHRVVWRCNALNAASMRAAERFGFTPEGIWREAEIVKGRRRDTAWFSLLEQDWPRHRARFEAWLDDNNFDSAGLALRPMLLNDQ